ncbi:MAG: acyl-CoA dehydrogenase family protein [Gammaproteobacteria bacterium]
MDFTESEEIAALRDTVRRFAIKEFPPAEVARWDREDDIPRSAIDKLAALGLCGINVPEEYGGMGRQVQTMAAVMVELARHSQALAAIYNMNVSYGSLNIASSGSEAQKKRLLPALLEGKLLFAYGLSEPDTGADLTSVRTRAERHGDRVVINGAKRWTSGANLADYIYALVRSGPPEDRRRNLSFVLIPTAAPGVRLAKLGAMGAGGVALYDVMLENVEIAIDDVIGGEAGWNNAWAVLAGPALEVEKLGPSCIALGIAEAAMAEAWEYSQQRVQGGKHICGHQAVRHVLADCQTRLQACRLMLQHAAWLVETGRPSAVATSMAKVFITEHAKEITLSCQQYVMGAYGYAHGFAMERYVRDVLAPTIYGGSTAIQRNNIANLMKLPRE